MVTGLHNADVARLAAVRTIIQSIDAKSNVVLRLAETAEFFASALRFRFVALQAQDCHRIGISAKKLYASNV